MILALWLLATLDCALAGYRSAGGRSAVIDKTWYYRRAMLQGAAVGQAAVVAVGLLALGLWWAAPDRAALWEAYEDAIWRMFRVYTPYAAIVIATFMVRAIPLVDVKSLTSVLVLGPLTFLRPVVIFAGLAAAAWGETRPEVLGVLAAIGVSMIVVYLGIDRLAVRSA